MFLVFGYRKDQPYGGWRDFVGVQADYPRALALAEMTRREGLPHDPVYGHRRRKINTFHIVDTETWKIVTKDPKGESR